MACTNMQQGEKVKVNGLKEAAEAKIKKRAQELLKSKDAVKQAEGSSAMRMLEKIKANIMAGRPALTDKVGTGPGHVHVFRWADGSFVDVGDVEYQKVSINVSLHGH